MVYKLSVVRSFRVAFLSFNPQEIEASDLRAGVWFGVVFILLEQCLYLFLWT